MSMDWNKFKALVHYVCEKAEKPSVLGSIKLNKVLWYSDAFHYMAHGRSITGATYVKRQFGPVPTGVIKALDQLVSEGKIARGRVDNFSHGQLELVALEDADKSIFDGQEISLVDEAFEHVCLKHTAMSISEETHGTIWKIAKMGELLPYETVFAYHLGEVDETDFAWAKEKLAA